MSIYSVEIKKVLGKNEVHFKIGNQGFIVHSVGYDKENVEWLKRMLNNALYELYQSAYNLWMCDRIRMKLWSKK